MNRYNPYLNTHLGCSEKKNVKKTLRVREARYENSRTLYPAAFSIAAEYDRRLLRARPLDRIRNNNIRQVYVIFLSDD